MNLHEFYDRINETQVSYPRDVALHEVIADVCAKNQSKIAVFFENDSLTYGQLDKAANQLANYLIEKGVQQGDLIGVCCNRNIDMPILINGILRTGAGYVPLDPDYPLERLQYMVANAELKHVVAHQTYEELAEKFDSNVIYYDREIETIENEATSFPLVKINPGSDVAYVIFTSGSTGKPKGVLVPHRAAVNLMFAFQQKPGFTSDDRILATTTLSFDLSVIEMFLPLVAGGQMAIIDRKTAKNQELLIDAIKKFEITFMQATPSMWRIICESDFHGGPKMKFITGGEPLPRDLIDPMLQRCGELWNCYGPTEATVWSSVRKMISSTERILVGKPLNNTTAYIVDEFGELCPPETEGEVWIGGDCVSLGYMKRDELTAEKYVMFNGERVYRSGDLGKIVEDGEVEIVGRIDSQIKLRGHRIELGEIDAAMAVADENVRLAAAVVREDLPGDIRLVGYVLPHDGKSVDLKQLKKTLEQTLPEYMIPAVVSVVDKFPYTPSGKTDRKAFPPPSKVRPDLGVEYVKPKTSDEKQLADIWRDILQLDRIGTGDNFFELGGNSIKALKVVKFSNEALGTNVSTAEFFDAPTIRQFILTAARRIKQLNQPKSKSFDDGPQKNQFAVIGMAVRMPGAKNVDEYWSNLVDGKESIRFFDEKEIDSTISSNLKNDPNYVKARGIVDGADLLDAKFFNMPPREAQLVDPQQRLMLELSWTALEDAGCIPAKFDGSIGVWAGCYETSYFQKNLLTNPEIVEETGEFQLGVYNEKDYIATRVAHRLNLRGPAVNVNTACSTSLVAIIEACNALKEGQCDVAIAGGVSIHFPQNSGHLHQEGSIFSPDGHCRPFDIDSAGTLFSDGAGVVVIKRLEDAIKANDRVYAIVKGFGINNDGGNKASFSAPSIEGQAAAIAMAHASADVDAETIGYVEAHGTATPIGDPIEIAALTRAFSATTEKNQFCTIGSVKGNIGHTVSAAGVAGFVKTALALFHEKIPATLHYTRPNPQIDFESTPFSVCSELQTWHRNDTPRRAGVSSFGVGGTNAHVILEEAPVQTENVSSDYQLINVSAKSESAREQSVDRLASFLDSTKESFPDVASTLNSGRADFKFKAFCVASSKTEAALKLAKRRAPELIQRTSLQNSKSVVFMFPGQGSQYVRMGLGLYQSNNIFKQSLDNCCDILTPILDRDLRSILFPKASDKQSSEKILGETKFTQPALFSIGYSLAQVMLSLGVQPDAMVGHSVGEFVAACTAQVFGLEDGLRLIAKRGELMQQLPEGKMLSVRMSGQDLESHMSGQMAVASYNGPELCVVAGPNDQVAELKAQLESKDVTCKYLHASHAFHSPMMDSIVDPYSKFVSEVDLQVPAIPIISTVTGSWMRDEEAVDPAYWAEHLRQPVRFSDAISELWNENPELVLVELGPRKTLATLSLQHAKDRKIQVAIPTMSDTSDDRQEQKSFLTAVGHLWSLGVDLDLSTLSGDGRKTSLPTYPFERKSFFVEPGNKRPEQATTSAAQETNQTVESEPCYSGNIMNRIPKITESIFEVFENSSGFDLSEFDNETTFFEMGLDSLVLTQTASALKRAFDVEVTFRQLLEDTPNVVALAEFLDSKLPADKFAIEPGVASPETTATVVAVSNQPKEEQAEVNVDSGQTCSNQVNQAAAVPVNATVAINRVSSSNIAESVINNQLQVMAAQLQLLGGNVQLVENNQVTVPSEENVANEHHQSIEKADLIAEPASRTVVKESSKTETVSSKKAFGAAARVNLNADELTELQQAKLDEVIRETEKMMPQSKEYAQKHRKYMADPRTVSGFRPSMKEMTFPIVVQRSKGVELFDLDGNQFVDYTCGFGSNFLGHSTDLIVDAVGAQLPVDYSIGPQSPLAGEVAKMFCEMTGNERMAYSNTGSEAVLGCTRLARTYTGKQKIAMFTGDYHGILDEVIVRGNKSLRSFPAATGIPREHVDNTLVLDYGTDESLQLIRENLNDLAAIVVETVQSRRPELQPVEFLRELRAMTENVDTALIFDEVITGFRIAPGGAQQHFGIRADLASYGKVVGGGMPIGLIGGRAEYMDGLDGGYWQYGDDSRPEAGMTYFAGTFVRHPLTLASAKAILGFIQSEGQSLYDRLNALSDNMAFQLNAMFNELDAPIKLANFGSMFKVQFDQELPYSELIFAKLRLKGFFIWDHRPCLLNVQHTQEHVDAFVKAFREVIIDLQRAGFVPGQGYKKFAEFDPNQPPCPEAKVGKDRKGNPGWFMADASNPGQFVQVNQTL